MIDLLEQPVCDENTTLINKQRLEDVIISVI